MRKIQFWGLAAVGSGQWAVGSGQLTVGSGQWTVGSAQWTVGSGQATGNSLFTIHHSILYTLYSKGVRRIIHHLPFPVH